MRNFEAKDFWKAGWIQMQVSVGKVTVKKQTAACTTPEQRKTE